MDPVGMVREPPLPGPRSNWSVFADAVSALDCAPSTWMRDQAEHDG